MGCSASSRANFLQDDFKSPIKSKPRRRSRCRSLRILPRCQLPISDDSSASCGEDVFENNNEEVLEKKAIENWGEGYTDTREPERTDVKIFHKGERQYTSRDHHILENSSPNIPANYVLSSATVRDIQFNGEFESTELSERTSSTQEQENTSDPFLLLSDRASGSSGYPSSWTDPDSNQVIGSGDELCTKSSEDCQESEKAVPDWDNSAVCSLSEAEAILMDSLSQDETSADKNDDNAHTKVERPVSKEEAEGDFESETPKTDNTEEVDIERNDQMLVDEVEQTGSGMVDDDMNKTIDEESNSMDQDSQLSLPTEVPKPDTNGEEGNQTNQKHRRGLRKKSAQRDSERRIIMSPKWLKRNKPKMVVVLDSEEGTDSDCSEVNSPTKRSAKFSMLKFKDSAFKVFSKTSDTSTAAATAEPAADEPMSVDAVNSASTAAADLSLPALYDSVVLNDAAVHIHQDFFNDFGDNFDDEADFVMV